MAMEQYPTSPTNNFQTNEKKRGWLLTIYLIIIIIASAISAYTYIFNSESLTGIINISSQTLLAFQILTILNIIFGVAIFSWKKWGVYGLGLSFIVSSILSISIYGIIGAIIGLVISLGILLLIIKSRWKYF